MNKNNENKVLQLQKQPNSEPKQPRFIRTAEGISRFARSGKQGELPFYETITTDGLCPQIIEVIHQIHPGDKREKIRVIQVGMKECRIDSKTWTDSKALARQIDLINEQNGQIITKQRDQLAESLDCLDKENIKLRTEYYVLGWDDNRRFLLPKAPALSENEAVISIGNLPYEYSHGDIELAKKALDTLLSTSPEQASIIFSFCFTAPLIRPLNKPRFILYLCARAGKGKTEIAKRMMCLFGSGWKKDKVPKFSATANAAIKLTESARDLPLLLDNFRPQNKGHIELLNTFIIDSVEGQSRSRLNQAVEFREQSEISTLPMITGETFPEGDSGMLGRVLLIEFSVKQKLKLDEWRKLGDEIQQNFPVLGWEWISYLTKELATEENRKNRQTEQDKYIRTWEEKAEKEGQRSGQNMERVIINISLLEFTWDLAKKCKAFSQILEKHDQYFKAGLYTLFKSMINQNETESLGALALDVIQDADAAKETYLRTKGEEMLPPSPGQINLGWREDKKTIYVIPGQLHKLLRTKKPAQFSHLSARAINKALEEYGLIATQGEQHTVVVKIQGKSVRVLHLKTDKELA